ncbi:ATP-dependent DNA helicase PIF1-like protein [Tanacetum coccineum]
MFSHLYIYDTKNEVQNKIKFASNGETTSSGKKKIDHQLTTEIRDMLDTNNLLRDGRKYDLPMLLRFVAALIVGDFDSMEHKRDIILERQGGDLKQISELHPSYLALQEQKDLRSETYSKLAKLAADPDSGVTIRDLFITFTCNPNWPEIARFVAEKGLKSDDRPDVITRVFKQKLDSLMKDFNKKALVWASTRRYLLACEAAWRIYGFDIHYRFPPVESRLHARGVFGGDDKEYIDGLLEASQWGMGNYLRRFFVMLIMTDGMSRPESIYEKTWHVMATNVESIERVKKNALELVLTDEAKKNYRLLYIEHMLLSNNKSLKNIPNMSFPTIEYTMDGYNRDPSTPSDSRQDVVHVALNSSYLWNHCTVMKLTVNMRLGSGSNSSERKEIQDFADWILNIRNGKIGGKNDEEANVEFPDDMLILESDDHIGSIIHKTYPGLLQNIYDPDYFQERAILAPTHELVDMINDRMLSLIHRDEKTYNSSNTVGVADVDTNFNETIYTEVFLNNLNMAGIPHHSTKLKIGIRSIEVLKWDSTRSILQLGPTVLRYKKKMKFVQQPIGPTPDPETADHGTIDKTLEKYNAFDMMKELKTMFEEQAKQELFETVKAFHACKQEDVRSEYNMHSMGKTLAELHAMLKLHEKVIPKKAGTPAVLAIHEGKIQKDKKKP